VKAIEKMDSKECAAALKELAPRSRQVRERLAAIKPSPHETRFAGGRPSPPNLGPSSIGAPRFDPLRGSGAEYRRILLEGTPGELVELEREREELEAEARQLSARRDALRGRLEVAQREEKLAAAPKRLDGLRKGADAVLDRLDAARRELADAASAQASYFGDLAEARKLVGADAPGLSPLQVRRLVADEKGDVWWLRRNENGEIVHNAKLLAAVRSHLEPVPLSLIQRLRRRFGQSVDQGEVREHDEAAVRDEADHVRCRLIAEAEYDAANDFECIGRESVKGRFRSPGTRPSDAQVDRWLTPKRAKIAT
jgi:hypothetical protein